MQPTNRPNISGYFLWVELDDGLGCVFFFFFFCKAWVRLGVSWQIFLLE